MTTLTVLASLILIVSEGPIEGREFAELVALEFILTFGDRGSLMTVSQETWNNLLFETFRFNNIVDKLLRFVDLLLGIGHNQAV